MSLKTLATSMAAYRFGNGESEIASYLARVKGTLVGKRGPKSGLNLPLRM